MKYFSIETVVNAYKGFQDCMTNKSWGYLAILRGCKSSIRPSVPFEVDMDMVSNFLENIFNLSQTKKKYESGRSLYVVFSNKWNLYFNYQGKYSPNLFDIIVWAYRRKAFHDGITKEKLFQLFSEEFNIPNYCYICGAGQMLEEINCENGMKMSDRIIEELWMFFGDYCLYDIETEIILENFLDFPAGTRRDDIWHWFDKSYSKGVYQLLNM